MKTTHFRTHTCGELRARNEGETVRLAGWVRRVRNLGGLIFLDLRDRYGITQVVVEPQAEEAFEAAEQLGPEDVIAVEGRVRHRPPKDVNLNLPTGEIEVQAQRITILSQTRPLPFLPEDKVQASEETRLRYRFLDLRRPRMQRNLVLRHKLMLAVRNFLDAQGFVEIETPYLTKSTPEGARDFLVPSRLHPGKFYALPQSPQLYKQVLMISGFDRYFQLARCFRDEDLRADRQPEFTQIDLEMSFVDVEDVLSLTEALLAHLFREVLGQELPTPFPRMTYREAMDRFGVDKPDLRFGMELVDLAPVAQGSGFRVLEAALAEGGFVRGLPVPADLSRKQIEGYTRQVQEEGAAGLLWWKRRDGVASGPLSRYLPEERLRPLLPEENPLTLLVLAGRGADQLEILGRLRNRVAHDLGLIPEGMWKPLWVVEFPLFAWNVEENRIEPAHHMFSSPLEEDLEKLESDPLAVRGKIYDLVLNGVELGSGSIRIHRRDLQEKVMEIIGLSRPEAEKRFGFLLEAFEYGAPPHGGIALGFDRLVAMLAGEESIREVIAFPKTTAGQALYEGAPSEVDPHQLEELHIQIVSPKREEKAHGGSGTHLPDV